MDVGIAVVTINGKEKGTKKALSLCIIRKTMRIETVKISTRGQITIPNAVRARMNLNGGDTVALIEEDGKIYVLNTSTPSLKTLQHLSALKTIQQQMEGEAEKAGFNTPDDVAAYIRNMRQNKL
jgi:AbrB family looped-hinge helix DNA binding protein